MGLDGILNVILNYVLIISLWDALLFQIQPPIQNTGIINMYNYWGDENILSPPPHFSYWGGGGRRPSSPPAFYASGGRIFQFLKRISLGLLLLETT